MPMMRGGTPADAMPRMRASGVARALRPPSSEATISAAAPSLTPEALPAVTVPSGRTMRLELGQRLERGVGARMLVRVDPTGLPLPSGTSTGAISSAKRPVCLRRGGALLRAQREGILVRARDLEFLGDVLAGLRHRIDAVLLLHHRIDEAPADRGVVDLGRARERASALPITNGARRHAFDAAGDRKLDLAGLDRPRRRARPRPCPSRTGG